MRALSMQEEPTYLKNHYSHFHYCHFKHYSTNHEIDLCILSHSVLKHSDPLKAGRNLKNDPPELFQLTGGEAGATAGRWPLQEPHLVADSPRLPGPKDSHFDRGGHQNSLGRGTCPWPHNQLWSKTRTSTTKSLNTCRNSPTAKRN